MDYKKEISSFRDPEGFIYSRGGVIYRHINNEKNLIELESSGLYKELVDRKLIIPYEWVSETDIKPQQVPFISYSYEWPFNMVKEAALCTLDICRRALLRGMILKDSSAFNIQHVDGQMKLIDHLSLRKYREGEAWLGYRQFCQHFLSPLLLMDKVDLRLGKLTSYYIDGIPLDLTSTILPRSTYLNTRVLLHIHLQAKAQSRLNRISKTVSVRKVGLLGLLDNLESLVKGLKCHKGKSFWSYYSKETNYSRKSYESKLGITRKFLELVNPKEVWDLGCNLGDFSKLAAGLGSYVVALDSDPVLVDNLYLERNKSILPLNVDLTNPTQGVGWLAKERKSLLERGPADCVLSLALIHHLCIVNNTPISYFFTLLSRMGRWSIVEWVPKEDSQVQRLLKTREDIFCNYNLENFEREANFSFKIVDKIQVENSLRVIYLLRGRDE